MRSSPKNWRKNGSLKNGERRCWTTCVDEMLTTAPLVRAATCVKSGSEPPCAAPLALDCASAYAAGAVAGAPVAGCAAAACSADCMRPVMTRPAVNPSVRKRMRTAQRLSMVSPYYQSHAIYL